MNARYSLLTGMVFALLGGTAVAQTCANPIPIVTTALPYSTTNNSCAYNDNMDVMWGGSVYTPGREVVYQVRSFIRRAPNPPAMRFILSPISNYDPTVFACQQCGALAMCIDGDDTFGPGGTETLSISAQTQSYFLIVDSTSIGSYDNCGQYALQAYRQ